MTRHLHKRKESLIARLLKCIAKFGRRKLGSRGHRIKMSRIEKLRRQIREEFPDDFNEEAK